MSNADRSPRVSVLMPAYNCESYVAEAIESILNQTFTDWELLVADDGSTDLTREIIEHYTDPRIRTLHSDVNLGLVRAWNRLLDYARGEYITWQDADDIAVSTRLEVLTNRMDTEPDLMLCGSNAVRKLKLTGEQIITSHPLTDSEIKKALFEKGKWPFLGGTRIIRREVLQHVEWFREFFYNIGGEDIDFIMRICERYRVANVPDVLYVYRYTRNSNSRKYSKDDTFLKLHVQDVAFFLADQRKRDNGLDGLMPGGNSKDLDKYIEDLKHKYLQDKSVSFRRACQNKISNQDYGYALFDAMQAVRANPLVSENYFLFIKLLGSLGKASVRMVGKRLHNSNIKSTLAQ